jgi:hypothetical protein
MPVVIIRTYRGSRYILFNLSTVRPMEDQS